MAVSHEFAEEPATEGSSETLASLQQQLGVKQHFKRAAEIYAEGSQSKHWYQVEAGVVRSVILFADGQRHIANFNFAGDYFGLEFGNRRKFSAEAVTDCVLYRYPRRTIEQLISELPQVARQLWNLSLKDLAQAQSRATVLGRMNATMRVASFLLELSERQGSATLLDLPMSRTDIADYLGLTIETTCRVLTRLAEVRLIGIPDPHHIQIIDTRALGTITVEGFDPVREWLSRSAANPRRRPGTAE